MMSTVEKAKQRWCPFTRTGINGDRGSVAVNRTVSSPEQRTNAPYDIYDETRCIGTACMAWRWGAPETQLIETPTDNPPKGEGWEKSNEAPKNGGATVWKRKRPDRPGFCGLAGPARND